MLKHIGKRINPDIKYTLELSIRTKIKGEARVLIANAKATSWKQIRALLLERYADQRTVEILTTTLTQCVQQPNQSYLRYYDRISKHYNALMENLQLYSNDHHPSSLPPASA